MGGTEEDVLHDIDEKCDALRVTSPSAMGSGNQPDGMNKAKKNPKKDSSLQEDKRAMAMARKV